MTEDGWCSKASCSCDGESATCRLKPKLKMQVEFSFACGGTVPLLNCSCRFFRLMEFVKHE
jgi:hypothetical protein